jgi:PAS domain S-box-containing protein
MIKARCSEESEMQDKDKTNEQLITELAVLRKRVSELEEDKEPSSDVGELRHSAEKRVSERQTEKDRTRTEDADKLFHELVVHQVELEMQNEELRNAQVQLEQSRSKYSDLYEFAPVGYLTLDEKGLVLEANLTIARQLGIERSYLINYPFPVYIVPANRNVFRSHLNEVVTSEQRQSCQIGLLAKSGGDFYARIDSVFVRDASGKSLCRTTVTDITERKRAEEALRESEEKYRNLFNNTEIAMFRSRLDGSENLEVNQKFLDLVGRTREETEGKPSVILWEDPKSREEMVRRLVADGRVSEFEFKMLNEKRGVRVCVTSLVLYREQEILEGSIRDITELKYAEVELLESENKFKSFAEQALTGIYLIQDGAFNYVNPRFAEMFGYTVEELQDSTPFKNLVYEEDLPMVEDQVRRRISGEVKSVQYTFRGLKKNGQIFPVEIYGSRSVHNGKPAALGTILDITERKRAEEALRVRNKLQSKLLGLSQQHTSDLDSFLRIATETAAKILKVERVSIWFLTQDLSELHCENLYQISKNAHENGMRLFAKDYPRYFQALSESRTVAAGDALTDSRTNEFSEAYLKPLGITSMMDVPIYHHGNIFGVICHEHVGIQRSWELEEQDFSASISHMVSIALEGSERKQAEQALKESEEKFSLAFRTSPYAIAMTRADDGRFVEVNDAFTSITGFTKEEALNSSSVGLKLWANEEDRNRVKADLLNGRKVVGQDFRFRKKNGEIISGLFAAETILLKNERCILSSINDITERKKAEEEKDKMEAQLNQAQKMEAVGRLAGGVAHDFNNMLSIIIGHAELVLDEISLGDPFYHDITEMRTAANRSVDLTRQLLAFARKQTISPKVLDLNETASGILNMLRRLIGEDINLAWVPGLDVWPVKMDPGQIDQILANLAVNARDAIGGVGTMTIETANVVLDESYSQSHKGFVPGDYVMLAVSDTGSGMDKQTVGRIYEPFFTTKELGKGTGLGLATVYGIVKQNNGFINVYSEPGQGTTFKIYLPRAEDHVEEKPTMAGKKDLKGTETVLLVEDEEPILALGKTILERRGYVLLATHSPDEALRMALSHPGPIHLLITDVVMPGMNGKDLRDKLDTIKPGFKCIFMSGYTADVIAHRGVLDEGVDFLQKPFSVKTLAEKVREVLDT